MTFRPGVSGNPGGRPKSLMRPEARLTALGISPVDEILSLIPELKPTDQLKAWIELLAYCWAKPREVEVQVNPLLGLSNSELIKIVKEKLPELEAMK